MSKEEEIEQGHRARALLADPVLQSALAEARFRAQRAWLESVDPVGAAAAREQHLAVDSVENILRRYGAEGEYVESLLRKQR